LTHLVFNLSRTVITPPPLFKLIDSDLGQVYKFKEGDVIAVLEMLKQGAPICTMRQIAQVQTINCFMRTLWLLCFALKFRVYLVEEYFG
jgi:hypothetical protein